MKAKGFLTESPSAPEPELGRPPPSTSADRKGWRQVLYGSTGEDRFDPEAENTYQYVWDDYKKLEVRVRDRVWWPDAPEPPGVILMKMIEECFSEYKRDHWLLHSKKDIRMMRRWCRRRVNHHSIRHFKSRNRTQLLNQAVGITARQYKDMPGRISMHLLRNGTAGVGYRNKALRRRPLALAIDWSSRVYDSEYVQLFNWNAGNLSRNCKGDALNDVMISPYHIETVQEASTVASQPALFEARGVKSVSSRDGTIMINSGGAGYKMARKTHSDENQFCD